jgi:hypothetical protein
MEQSEYVEQLLDVLDGYCASLPTQHASLTECHLLP